MNAACTPRENRRVRGSVALWVWRTSGGVRRERPPMGTARDGQRGISRRAARWAPLA